MRPCLAAVLVGLTTSFLAGPRAIAVPDTQKPACKIKADYVQPGPGGSAKFTFVVDADDNDGVKRLEYRAAVSGGTLGAFRPYPYVPGTRLTFTVNCTSFAFQIRAVDRAGNVSSIQSRGYAAPFKPRPVPRPEPVLKAPAQLSTAQRGQIRSVVVADANGDGRNDLISVDKTTRNVTVRLNSGNGTTYSPITFSVGESAPEALAAGNFFGPLGSAANDTRPDLAVAAGSKIIVLINSGGGDAGTLSFPESAIQPVITAPSVNFTGVAVGDVNGDGFDDIIGCGSGVNPDNSQTQGVVAVALNLGVVGGSHGGFAAPVLHFTGQTLTFIERVALGDVDADGDLDLVSLVQEFVPNEAVSGPPQHDGIAVLRNDGVGTFGDETFFPTTFKPTAVALGDLTNDGYLDIALFGSAYNGSGVVAGVEVFRNVPDAEGEVTGFVTAGIQQFVNLPGLPADTIFPADIVMADVTLDGIRDLVFGDYYTNSVRVIQIAAIRKNDGEFDHFELEKEYVFKDVPGPLRLAVGNLNGDEKPDIATGNFSNNEISVLLNNKGNDKKTTPLEVLVSARPESDPETTLTINGDRVLYRVSYANLGFDVEPETRVSVVVPPQLEVVFVDANQDGIDDVYGFDPVYTKGKITAVAWEVGNLNIGASGARFFKATVAANAQVGAKLTATGKIKAATKHQATGKAVVSVTTSITVEAFSQQPSIDIGGLIEFRARLRNRASYAAKSIIVVVPIPENLHVLHGETTQPGFIDAAGNPVQLPGSSAVIDELTRKITYRIATVGANSDQLLRFFVRVPGDYVDFFPAGGQIKLTDVFVQQRGSTKTLDLVPGQILATPTVQINVPATPAARTSLYMGVLQDAAGRGPESKYVTVTTKAAAIPDTNRKANQIRYRFAYGNAGTLKATDTRFVAFLPPKTKLERKSVRINNLPVSDKAIRVLTLDLGSPFVVSEDLDGVFDNAFLYLDLADVPGGTIFGGNLEFTVTLTSKAKTGDEIQLISYIDCAEQLVVAPSNPILPTALVVPPAVLTELKSESVPAQIDPANPSYSSVSIFQNTGGVVADGVKVTVAVPQGATYVGAHKLDSDLRRYGAPLSAPNPGASSGTVVYDFGKLQPGAIAAVETRFNLKASAVETSGSSSRKGLVVAEARITDRSEPAAAAQSLAERSVRGGSSLNLFGSRRGSAITQAAVGSGEGRLMMLQKGPAYASPGSLITYTVVWANMSDNTVGAPLTYFAIPRGTTFVSVTPTVSLNPGDNNQQPTSLPAADPSNPRVVWGDNPEPHRAILATVTVRVDANALENTVIRSFDVWSTGDNVSRRCYAAPINTVIVRAGASADQIRNSLIGSATGDSAQLAASNPEFLAQVDQWVAGGPALGLGGADALHLSTGAVVIPIGGGQIVAAGAGNLIGHDGSSLASANGGGLVNVSGGQLVAAGAGNLITDNGAGIVAAGAGNLVTVQGLVPSLSQSNLYNLASTMVAAGAGNLLPGSSLVAAGAGNIIAAGGGNLIGTDGATLINNETGNFVNVSGSFVGVFPQADKVLIPGKDTGYLIGLDGGSLVGQAGPLVSSVSAAGNLKVSAGLITDNGAGIVAAGAGNLIGTDGATIVAAGAGNIIAAGGGNLIGTDGASALPMRSAPSKR